MKNTLPSCNAYRGAGFRCAINAETRLDYPRRGRSYCSCCDQWTMSATSSIFDNSRLLVTLLQNLERLKHSFMVCNLFEVSAIRSFFSIFRIVVDDCDVYSMNFLGSEDQPLAWRRALADYAIGPQRGALDVAAADRPELPWQAKRSRSASSWLLTGRRSAGER